MKYVIKSAEVFAILFLFIFFTNCSKESEIQEKDDHKIVELTFKNGTVIEKLHNVNGVWVSKSNALVKMEFKDTKTGQIQYGYALNDINKSGSSEKKAKGSIERGLYGWDGSCFIWGTLVTDDQGETLFIPASFDTQQMLNVCPYDGSSYAKKKRE